MKKFLLGLISGLLLCSGVVYAVNLLASDIEYDNSKSDLKDSNNDDVTNVQDAIDALYTKANRKYKKSVENLKWNDTNILTYSFNPEMILIDCNGVVNKSWGGSMAYIKNKNKYFYFLQPGALQDGASTGSITINDNIVTIAKVAGSINADGYEPCTVIASE